VGLKDQGGRYAVHAEPPLVAAHSTFDEGAFGRHRGQPLVDEFHGQARFLADLVSEVLRGLCLWATRPVEPLGQADHDARGLIASRDLREAGGQRAVWLCRNRGQRLGDRSGRVAESEANPL
jgi:hypothetical protein